MSIWLIRTPLGQRNFTHAPIWTPIEKQNCQCRPDNLKRHRKAPHGLRIMCENHTKVAIQSSQYAALALFRRVQTANLHPVCERRPKTGARNHYVNTFAMLAGDGSHFGDENWNHRGTNPLPTPCQNSLASDSKYL